ncbi:FAD-dependent monooxygenase [Georgenia halophila]|uniref:FAD-dependent monooxygenase n=1 Tax=Georgenia halophila TaxID=620889 RepID=A0ABP8LNP4_9MICO
METDVLVVGAGPTGLMLSAWLTRLGVAHELVDGKAEPTRQSRALGVHSRSMEIYAQLGMIDPVRDRVTWAPRVRPGWESRAAAGGLPLGRLGSRQTPYPGVHILEQSVNERLLLAHLESLGGQVSWRHRLETLTDHGTHVEAGLEGPDGQRTVTARWCVGADGAGSRVRTLSGIGFGGVTNPQTFWLADARGVRGTTEGAINIRAGSDRFLITFPMPGRGHHRIIGMVSDTRGDGPGGDGSEIAEDDVRGPTARQFGVEYDVADWFTTYRIHHRVAERFRSGRVLLAGDAAHVHSPVGAQGMNTGLQDAHNLAFKLADVVAGRAHERLMDRYAAERVPVAHRLVGTTDRIFRAVISPAPAAVRVRRFVVPTLVPLIGALLPLLPGSERIAQYIGQTRIHYWMSGADRRRGKRGKVVGRRLPWTGANHDCLTAATWQVHAYGSPLPPLEGLPVLVEQTHRFDPRHELGLTPERWLLVRPDGFVAAAAVPEEAGTVFAEVLREHGYHDEVLVAQGSVRSRT